jgi:hypothetical protein
MRADIQKIFMSTPRLKQVMMFSATMPENIRAVARKFMTDVSGTCLPPHALPSPYLVLCSPECSRWRSRSTRHPSYACTV